MRNMSRLLKLQTRVLLRSKFFYVCTFVTLLAPLIFFFIGTGVNPEQSTTVVEQAISGLQGMGSLIVVIVVALFVCIDFEDGTAKNIIARGYSRKQLLISKYLVSLFGVLVISILCSIFSALLSLNQPFGDFETFLLFLPAFFATTAASVSLYTLVSYFFESKGTAIMVGLIGPNMVSLVITFIQSQFKLKFNLSKYWIEGLLGLINMDHITMTSLLKVSGISFAYVVVILGLGILLTRKKEVK